MKQIEDYDNELVWTIRQSNYEKILQLYSAGRSMCACNKFSESIIHMACRRSDFAVVDFILSHGGNETMVDDFGRTPLHDACWRSEPGLDIVTILLDRNPDLLRYADRRGASPLSYVREEDWLEWCAFLFFQKDRYWPIQNAAC
jgi:ankyrin repeat protein